ncbi:DNA topoisomerase III [Vibrio sp. SS-MA-C1-2]|uniref:DNA topoisomerase III n=1 Tax=Vibrio sp. SS-MA-C1-2 TaxID=2908646 RepID=UPI001F24ADA7|nr:DNA topoisomerase III [Vibrio sp. SS-MA-C1-2]UJF19859.1 DNA topoisomerase III [Vibrio sp. SS-MA-C1-2]
MSRLFIAEKPSLGRAIANVLPRPHKNHTGYITTGNGDIVTWCVGHLLEQLEPDAYDPQYKVWRLDDLPIIPEQWKLKARKGASKQLTVIKKLLKEASSVVHAGDPDREGQLLVDEVISHLKYPVKKRTEIQRLLINDLNPSAVKKALGQMRSNSEFIPLSVSALARSRADWLYGMNMTRAYTLLGQKSGYRGVLSVGRVQTPILGLVVRRDQEIANFIPQAYYQVEAVIPYQNVNIIAKWQPSEACQPWQDPQGRVLNRKLAENVAERITNQPAVVSQSQQKNSQQAPPLPYSLSALQIDAAKRYGINAADVLTSCQSLYERHKVITYPRSDSRYLPNEHFKQAKEVVSAISSNNTELTSAVNSADLTLRSKAWNDKKVEAHHAIIPTPKKVSSSTLNATEAKVYGLIARQYLFQFYPAAVYADSSLVFIIANGHFIAKGRDLIEAGWRELLTKSGSQTVKSQNNREEEQPKVPALKEGTELHCIEGQVLDKMTEPPKMFTDASLLQAMTGISRFVLDSELKKILRDTDGLGTEATRAHILELLFKRQLLLRKGKVINASDAAIALITALPNEVTYPDMTAHWEHQLQDITDKKCAYAPFIDNLTLKLNGMISNVKSNPVPDVFQGLKNQAPVKSFKKKRRVASKKKPTGK